eukprot:c20201_g1_i1.p1 GENE.c20201_g1_i1~~c20201_g1_i1.p1  ORF type:complete len:575 (+),score=118.16 c20201_g1_i1:251-1726(+)
MFVDNGTLHHTQYIHVVEMTGLQPLTDYVYRIPNGTAWTDPIRFRSPGVGDWAPRFTLFGDFGLENARALPALALEAALGATDVFVHVGDFAYDMYEDNATKGDLWFHQIEPLASHIPYMVCPGNHEGMYDFLNYRSRFAMPQRDQNENLFHSFDAGVTHWVAYDTEVYFVYDALDGHGGVHRNFGPYPEVAKRQLAFVDADLTAVNQNRDATPWVFAYGHRPMYCSDNDDDDCVKMLNQWKHDLEDLFYKHGVDIVFEAHQHSYERTWPVYNGTVHKPKHHEAKMAYVNPKAPVHIVTGSAGCREGLDTFGGALGPWSAVRISDYGYGHLTIQNKTHLLWEQLSVDGQAILDSIWLVKDTAHPNFKHSAARHDTRETHTNEPNPPQVVKEVEHVKPEPAVSTTTHHEQQRGVEEVVEDKANARPLIGETKATTAPATREKPSEGRVVSVLAPVSGLLVIAGVALVGGLGYATYKELKRGQESRGRYQPIF